MIQYVQEILLATLRLLISLTDTRCWFGYLKKDKALFINRKVGEGAGGPTRFLRQLVDIANKSENFKIENTYPCRAKSALVMSYAWRPFFYFQCKKSNTRTVLRLDGFYVYDDVNKNHKRDLSWHESYRNKQMKIGLKEADYVIYQSRFSKQQADQKLYKRNDFFSIISNGVDTEYFKPRIPKLYGNTLKLLVLGKHYGFHIEWVAQIFCHLRRNVKAKLIFVGPPRDKHTSVNKIFHNALEKSGFIDDVTIQGNVRYEELPQVITRGDILLHVKVGDSCPNAVIESMACGLPVVCPEFGGTRELVECAGISVAGPEWTMTPEMHLAMAEAIYEVYKNLSDYSVCARERATKYFDRRLAASRYLEVLDI